MYMSYGIFVRVTTSNHLLIKIIDNIIFTYEITWLLVVTRGYSYKSVVGRRNIDGYSCVNVDKDVFNLYLSFLKL